MPDHAKETTTDNDQSSAKNSNAYNRLRRWYLARLRKTALASAATADMTPATLVKLDQETIQKVLAQTGSEPTRIAPPSPHSVSSEKPFNWFSFCFSYWASTLVLTVLLIFQIKSFNVTAAAACIPSLFFGQFAQCDLPFPFPAAPMFFVAWPLYLILMSKLAVLATKSGPMKKIDLDDLG
jgi:hypothetical protein